MNLIVNRTRIIYFTIFKTLNSQGNLKKNVFNVLTIGFYTFCLSFRQIMDTIPKKLFLFQGKPFDEAFFDFFKIGEALLCEWVSHRCEKVIVEFNAFNVFFTTLAVWDGALSCCRITFSYLRAHSGRFSINAWFKLIIYCW